MADEDMMEMDELGEDEEGEESSGGNPLMKYLPWIAILLVVQVVLAYFVAQWFFVPDELPEDAQVEEVAPAGQAAGEGGEEEGGPGYERPRSEEVVVIYTQVPTIVVNPRGTEGLRFLSAEVHLGLSDQAVVDHIEGTNQLSRINDTMIQLFTSKTIADVDPSKHEQLKKEIMTALNAFLGKNAVLEVYFQSFVLQ